MAATTVAGLGIESAVAVDANAAVAKGPRAIVSVGPPLNALGPLLTPPGQGVVGPEAIRVPAAPLLPSTITDAMGAPVDGISCDTSEQVVYHIHVHLTVFVDGMQRQIPFGIGVPGPQVESTPQGPFIVSGSCFYWLHTHAADGIIHVESSKMSNVQSNTA